MDVLKTMTDLDEKMGTCIYSGIRKDSGAWRGIISVRTNTDEDLESPFGEDEISAITDRWDWGYRGGFAVDHLAYAILSDFYNSLEIPTSVIKEFSNTVIANLPHAEWKMGMDFLINWSEEYNKGETNE